jgi:hypothetical protein
MPTSLAGQPLVDPMSLAADCERQGIPTAKWWGRANSFVCPLHDFDGQMYGVGWALMWSEVYQKLPADVTEMDWVWTDPFGRTLTIQKVCLLNTEAAKWSSLDGRVTEYLLSVADRRYRLNQVAVGREYNTRGPDGEYVESSLDGGSPWTWDACLQDIWDLMAAVFTDLSTAPAFPSTPPGAPAGFYFYEQGAWECAWRVVEAAGFLLRYDPTTDVFDIIDPDTTTPAAVPADEQGRFVASNLPYRAKSPPWPETLRVTFPLMGTNVRTDVDVLVGEGGMAGTVVYADDDLPDVGANAAELADRADAVLRVWKWSQYAAWDNAFQQVQGVSVWCRQTLGLFYRTHWMVQDLGRVAGDRGGTISTSSSAGWWRGRPGLRLAGVEGAGSGGSGSGSGDDLPGRLIDYTYRDDCVEGVVYRFRNTWYQAYATGLVLTTGYQFERTNGCCECSGSGSGSGLPKISTPCGDVSESLLVEFTNGASFIITYVVGFDYWYGFTPDRFACDSQAGGLVMYCDGVDWHIGPVASFKGPDDAVVVPTSLDPFFLSYTGPDTTCPPTVTLVITEIP